MIGSVSTLILGAMVSLSYDLTKMLSMNECFAIE